MPAPTSINANLRGSYARQSDGQASKKGSILNRAIQVDKPIARKLNRPFLPIDKWRQYILLCKCSTKSNTGCCPDHLKTRWRLKAAARPESGPRTGISGYQLWRWESCA